MKCIECIKVMNRRRCNSAMCDECYQKFLEEEKHANL